MTTKHNQSELTLGFMMGTTYRKLSMLFQNGLKEHDITPEQWSVLFHIDRTEGLIQKDIAKRSGKDKPTTTRILDHLEGKGLVYKRTGENDRRSFKVYITEKGRSLVKETVPIEDKVTEEIMNCISSKEYELLMELLLRINNHVDQITDGE
ncbi:MULTISPECIES: MarR family winged helix-turn-helix transcriptional regulator [Paenibacillus]|uniref:MarR family winged helix-turn-helix transcriptional regulator n=1 Tax=Paenibacillus TaxID=44249 RepID=UPI00096FFDD8|nr:MarR family transcriptional regulator [Paenibacillus odorifer]MEC0129588.1 MarR family transcriptional regulator [Paenibacillus odorifer]MEC0225254.1 MarR family transcriptional regulator [Paenibacillus odorifer]OMD09780.1 MarR family transcriptional regulator [Paenibacillus odorifer]OME54551.1 MarR family transcriptional regulator [Paenibacillus odorifer]